MWYLSLARAAKRGITNFLRNGWLTFTATIVMALTLFAISFIVFLIFVYTQILDEVKNKIGINVYFYTKISEEEILGIKEELKKEIPEIKTIEYTSREEALKDFKEKNKDNAIILESIEVVGENPLEASLSLKVQDSNDLERIESELIAGKYEEYISKTDYSNNRATIEKLNQIIDTTRKIGTFIASMLVLISVLVTLNSIRLTMYTHKKSIEIMKLVGANSWFIKLPFITEGALYGIFASIIVAISWYPLAFYLKPSFSSAQLPVNPVNELNEHILLILPLQLLIGFSLGVISSLISIRRYLK
ncbi:MAG: FtsX-like permease family protein [Candidatus Moranbacteria bacterium]|nr:FtsX-like permease family protein [Candidatus Moranbacteria bacterium]